MYIYHRYAYFAEFINMALSRPKHIRIIRHFASIRYTNYCEEEEENSNVYNDKLALYAFTFN